MTRDLKISLIIIGIIATLTFVVMALPFLHFLYLMGPPRQGFQETKEDFLLNKESILAVRDYFIRSGFESISVHSTGEPGTAFAGLKYGRILITDSKVSEAIATLHRNGYQAISKSDNAVVFLRWTGFDVGKGVAYSIDGYVPYGDALLFLTWIEPLSIGGWYYYEANFDVWRMRNQQGLPTVEFPSGNSR